LAADLPVVHAAFQAKNASASSGKENVQRPGKEDGKETAVDLTMQLVTGLFRNLKYPIL
jgi:hypothetical protein